SRAPPFAVCRRHAERPGAARRGNVRLRTGCPRSPWATARGRGSARAVPGRARASLIREETGFDEPIERRPNLQRGATHLIADLRGADRRFGGTDELQDGLIVAFAALLRAGVDLFLRLATAGSRGRRSGRTSPRARGFRACTRRAAA